MKHRYSSQFVVPLSHSYWAWDAYRMPEIFNVFILVFCCFIFQIQNEDLAQTHFLSVFFLCFTRKLRLKHTSCRAWKLTYSCTILIRYRILVLALCIIACHWYNLPNFDKALLYNLYANWSPFCIWFRELSPCWGFSWTKWGSVLFCLCRLSTLEVNLIIIHKSWPVVGAIAQYFNSLFDHATAFCFLLLFQCGHRICFLLSDI